VSPLGNQVKMLAENNSMGLICQGRIGYLRQTRLGGKAYHQGTCTRLILELTQNQCRLIIQTYRIGKLKDPERSFIFENYVPVTQTSHIMLPGKFLRPGETELEIFIEGTYKVLQGSRKGIRIDKREITDMVHLSKGTHSYSGGSHQNSVVFFCSSIGRFEKKINHFRSQVYFGYSW